MVNHSSTHKEVMLAGLPYVHIQLGYTGKKVSHFSPHADAAKQFDVKACTELKIPVVAPVLPGLAPPDSSVEFSLK
jgi:hypothetical protein